jgi:hypothetical protein
MQLAQSYCEGNGTAAIVSLASLGSFQSLGRHHRSLVQCDRNKRLEQAVTKRLQQAATDYSVLRISRDLMTR